MSTNIQLAHNKRSSSELKGGFATPTRTQSLYEKGASVKQRTSPLATLYATTEAKPAAGSANLMSPQLKIESTLGANKRIGADMISK
jgi:hypothetical protein